MNVNSKIFKNVFIQIFLKKDIYLKIIKLFIFLISNNQIQNKIQIKKEKSQKIYILYIPDYERL